MFKNYLKIAFRNIKKHKTYSFINIAGLAIGLAVFMLISLYIQHELSYDRFHEKIDRIYRVEQILDHNGQKETTAGCPTPLSQALIADFPQFEAVTRVIRTRTFVINTAKNEKLKEDKGFWVDNSFLEVFSFPLIKGDPKTALIEPFSIVITEKMAEKLFGNEDPLGKVIRSGDSTDLKVTGVIKDVPANSHINFNILASVSTLNALSGPETFTRWYDNWVPVYVLLKPDHSMKELNEQIRFALKKYQGERSENQLYLRPVSRIHLYSHVNHELGVNGSIKNIYIFAAIALFVLVIACINFMNLTTARSADRAKEVGLRKVTGAYKSSLIKQFIGESILLAWIAMFIALILIHVLLPELNNIVNRQLNIDYANNWLFTLGLIAVTLLAGFFSGLYPAFVLSSFQPVRVLKGSPESGGRKSLLRRSLVVFQFFVSISLIIGTIIILQQVHYLLHKDVGYDSEQVMVIPVPGSTKERIDVFRSEILQNPRVINAGSSDYLPYSSTNWCYVTWEGAGRGEYMKMNVNYVDENLVPTYGMTIVQGRGFSKEFRADKDNVVILNESAARKIGWDDPIGKRIIYNIDYRSRRVGGARVIGIVKDYHFLSLHHTISPLMMRLFTGNMASSRVSVKVSAENLPGTIKFLKNKFNTMFPGNTFEYKFIDEDFQQMYLEERKAGRVILYLAILAIFIACLGLFGLVSFSVKQRTKEIGIRKVIGASVPSILKLLSTETMKLIGIANLLAWPAAYFIMTKWLQNFPYRTSIYAWVFVVAGFSALLVALVSVSYQSLKAALANPVDSLRYE